jgi:hypothetical protein
MSYIFHQVLSPQSGARAAFNKAFDWLSGFYQTDDISWSIEIPERYKTYLVESLGEVGIFSYIGISPKFSLGQCVLKENESIYRVMIIEVDSELTAIQMKLELS